MNKADLIANISEHADLSKHDVSKCIDSFVSVITNELINSNQVAIPSFGVFSVSNRAARTGRNPRTGEAIEIPASRVAKFKPGKGLKDALSS